MSGIQAPGISLPNNGLLAVEQGSSSNLEHSRKTKRSDLRKNQDTTAFKARRVLSGETHISYEVKV